MPKLAGYFLTFLLGAALVGLGLLLGGFHKDLEALSEQDPGANYFPEGMPMFEGSRPTPLGTDIKVNDVPMQVAYFETDRPVDEVRTFYLNEFKQMKIQAHSDMGDGWANVYGEDFKKNVQRLVAIQRQGARTFVFPSIVPLSAVPNLDPEKSGDVFIMPGASGYSEMSSREYGKSSRMILYQSPLGPAESTIRIAEGMAKLGWKGGQDLQGQEGSRVMEFSCESGRAAVMLMPQKGGGASVIINVQGGAGK
jgi:hypothetical protein